ncbi:hypothetical protein SAMN04487897_105118 [Paenibacillus sp. yr247]|uniref:hypothetical protein n=1 Tax=Paenibacillus sp. yr247 TaxID=1761880 RepID=UPI00088FAB09|nr:hypothetical protein [Paenibacillus sp. yr247]SDN84269.1 hypothetical protein SAMN04487897_105118 [Paenibacillus sp. yr247]
MRYTKKMVLSLTLISFLLSGCYQHMPALDSSMALASPSPTFGQTPQEESPTENVQNLREMQLVMLFQALIRMDRNASLTITAKQARDMLPLVRNSMDEGSMNDSERKQVLSGLTPEQKAFLDEQSIQVKKHMEERIDNLGEELSLEEREKRVEAFIQKRKSDRQVEPDMIEQANGANQPFDSRSMGISVEKQLMELLVSKHD